MPAISIDTFFACSLMVLLVLSAMATSSKLLDPYLNNVTDVNLPEKFEKIAADILLSAGTPSNWGQVSSSVPEAFGLANSNSSRPYELDIDKVTRLNYNSLYAVNYQQIFMSMKMPDVSFRIDLQPVFNVDVNLTSTFNQTDATVYQFEVSTVTNGKTIPATLKYYTIAENYLQSNTTAIDESKISFNVTLSNNVQGPALLAIFAQSAYDPSITSWNMYPFAHNSARPRSFGTYMNLSPLNNTLTVTLRHTTENLSTAYQLSYEGNSTLMLTARSASDAEYSMPNLLDSGPRLLVVTGTNSTAFFTECVAYPQVPVQTGASFGSSLSNVFSYTRLITIESAIFKCTLWFGGPRT